MRSALGRHPITLSTPDGDVLATGSGPSGELIAAWRASDADTVIAASFLAATGAMVRFLLPAVSALLRIPGARRLAVSALAKVPLRAAERPRASSWGHARLWWSSGIVRDGWLRVGEGHEFTAAVAAEVTQRLLKGEGRPGSHTPGALLGSELAEAAGATITITQGIRPNPKG